MKRFILLFLICSATNSCDVMKSPTEFAEQATAPSPRLLFQDDFSNINSGWDRAVSGKNSTDYENEHYRIFIETPYQDIWANPSRYFNQNIVVTVDFSQTEGPSSSSVGLLCGYVDVNNFVSLSTTGDGHIELIQYENGERKILLDVDKDLSFLKDKNQLSARCEESSLTLILNKEIIAGLNNVNLVQGDVGIIVSAYEEANAEFLFDNFVVLSIP